MSGQENITDCPPGNKSLSPTAKASPNTSISSSNHEQDFRDVDILADVDGGQPDKEAVPIDKEIVQPDLEVAQPDLEVIQPDLEVVQPDLQAVQPDLQVAISYTNGTERKSGKEVVVDTPNAQKRSRRSLIVRITVAVLAIAAVGVGVGVGLGVGLTKQGSMSQQASTTQQPGAPTVTSVNPSMTAGPASELRDETSFAAFEDSGLGRHLFFQNANGSIQHATYVKEWTFEDVGVRDARDLTPLAALAVPDKSIYLFYVTDQNDLISRRLQPGGSWQTLPVATSSPLSNTTRQLRAKYVPSFADKDTSALHILILTQYPDAGASTLHLLYRPTQPLFAVENIDMCPDATFGLNAPCAAAINTVSNLVQYGSIWIPNNNYSWSAVCASMILDPTHNLVGIGYDGLTFHCNLIGNESVSSASTLQVLTDMEITFIDGQLSVLYVANSSLVSNGGPITSSNLVFPYARMASFVLAESASTLYIYHQIGVSTIAEELFDASRKIWSSSNITIGV